MSTKVRVNKSETVYVAMPDYPKEIVPGVVKKSVSLDDIYDYDGPRVQLDFDADGRLIGVEVVA
jgi:hypothetical protein